MKRKKLLIFICWLYYGSTYAQLVSLDTVLSRIEKNNLSLLSYLNKIKADDELVNGANTWMPPKFAAEYDDIPYNYNPDKTQLRLSLMQDFPNPKKINAKQNYLQSISSIDKNESEFHKIELFTIAKEAFYKRYITEQKIKVLEESSKILRMMITAAEKQMAIARGDLAAVYKLEARLAENETMLVHEQNMVRSQTSTLNYLMNEDVNKTFDIDTSNLIKNYRALKSDMMLDSLDCKRSDIMRMSSIINSMRLNQTVMSMRSKPEFGMRLENWPPASLRND